MLTNTEIVRPFVSATQDVLSTMAGITAEAGKPFIKEGDSARGDVSAIVGVTGDMRGSVAISFTRECALALVRGMLGDDIVDVLQDTQDAVGEVTNMVSGKARAELQSLGVTLHGSTPSVIVGDGHIIRHISSSPIMVIPFKASEGDFSVEFCLQACFNLE